MGAIDKFLNAMKLNTEVDEDEYYDDYDDVEEVEEPKAFRKISRANDVEEERGQKKYSKVTPISKKKSSVGGMEIFCIKPTTMEDAKEITDTLLASKAVILNLNNIDIDLARRVLDFAMGTTYAINGTLQKITDSIFVIVPDGVDISGAFVDNITQ